MTTRKVDTVIRINIKQLITAFEGGAPLQCVDLQTGTIVPADDCDAQDSGHGRSGVMSGKRYILVPSIEQMAQEHSPVIAELLPKPIEALVAGSVFELIHRSAKNPGQRYAAMKNAVTTWLGLLAPPVDIELVDYGRNEVVARYDSIAHDTFIDLHEKLRNEQ